MDSPHAEQRFVPLDEKYNYGHFRTEHLIRDAKRTLTDRGIMPGEPPRTSISHEPVAARCG